MTLVVKIGGNDLDHPGFVQRLAHTLSAIGGHVVLVHGGGKEIFQLQTKLGLSATYVDGLRVTDDESLTVVLMVLAGLVNKRLVSALSQEGVDAIGICGIDRGAVKAEKLEHPAGDLGWVGHVVSVKTNVFRQLVDEGITPVLAPICWGDSGTAFNVNADHVAAAVAAGIGADELVFVSNVPGLLKDGRVVHRLTSAMVDSLMADGTITGGMIPKARSALAALDAGVESVRITDLAGLEKNTGTTVVEERVDTNKEIDR